MKVMNVGNTNYSNKNQQSFGMILDFTPKAKELFKPNEFEEIEKEAAKLKMKDGWDLLVKGKISSSVPFPFAIDLYSQVGHLKFSNMASTYFGNFKQQTLFALNEINQFFNMHVTGKGGILGVISS